MDKLEKLRKEIERRLEELNPKKGTFMGRPLRDVNPKTFPRESELEKLLPFIDSLQKETVSEDLQEAAKLHIIETRGEDVVWDENARCAMLDFKAGAKWQRQKDEHLIWQISTANYEKGIEECKQQMMKDVVETVVQTNSMSGNTAVVHLDCKYKAGDKVKLIIIKEEGYI